MSNVENKTKDSFKNKAIDWSYKFYESKWSFVTLIGINFSFFILQLLLFRYGYIEVLNQKFGDSDNWKVWISLSFSLLFSSLAYIGAIYTYRFENKKAMYFMSLANLLAAINAIVSKLYMSAFLSFLSLILLVQRYFVWKKDTNNKDKANTSFWIKCLIFLLIWCAITMPLSAFVIKQYMWPWDTLATGLNIVGFMALTKKTRWAYLVYLFASIISIYVFATLGNIVVIAMILIFKINDIFVVLAWSKHA